MLAVVDTGPLYAALDLDDYARFALGATPPPW
jgi:hypothetical protein